MNVHLLQNELTRAEAAELSETQTKSNFDRVGCFQ